MATFPKGNSASNIFARRIQIGSTVSTAATSVKITWMLTASDTITLRGIPAIGRGVAGQIPGTRPDQAAT